MGWATQYMQMKTAQFVGASQPRSWASALSPYVVPVAALAAGIGGGMAIQHDHDSMDAGPIEHPSVYSEQPHNIMDEHGATEDSAQHARQLDLWKKENEEHLARRGGVDELRRRIRSALGHR